MCRIVINTIKQYFNFQYYKRTMKCAKLHLQERSKTKMNKVHNEKPRRFCQKRMVDPAHEEDSRWTDVYTRLYSFYLHLQINVNVYLNALKSYLNK